MPSTTRIDVLTHAQFATPVEYARAVEARIQARIAASMFLRSVSVSPDGSETILLFWHQDMLRGAASGTTKVLVVPSDASTEDAVNALVTAQESLSRVLNSIQVLLVVFGNRLHNIVLCNFVGQALAQRPSLSGYATTASSEAYADAVGAASEAYADSVAEDAGSIAAWQLLMPEQPAAFDTVTIGDDVYEFVTGPQIVPDNIAVTIGATVDDTRDNLVAAVNGTAPAAHATATLGDEVTPARGRGTEFVLAENIAASDLVLFQAANALGGDPSPRVVDILLAESITHASDVWACGNVNVSTLGGRAPGLRAQSTATLTITAALIAAGAALISFPFTIGMMQIATKTGDANVLTTDTFAAVGSVVTITLAGGAAPALQPNDVVTITAWE